MNLNLKYFLFMLFRNSLSNLTKCILVLQQLQRKERMDKHFAHFFIYKPRPAPMGTPRRQAPLS